MQFQWWCFPRASRHAQRSRRSLLVCLGHCEFEKADESVLGARHRALPRTGGRSARQRSRGGLRASSEQCRCRVPERLVYVERSMATPSHPLGAGDLIDQQQARPNGAAPRLRFQLRNPSPPIISFYLPYRRSAGTPTERDWRRAIGGADTLPRRQGAHALTSDLGPSGSSESLPGASCKVNSWQRAVRDRRLGLAVMDPRHLDAGARNAPPHRFRASGGMTPGSLVRDAPVDRGREATSSVATRAAVARTAAPFPHCNGGWRGESERD